MEAGFAVELGREHETLELPWSAPGGPRYYDLKRRPELLLEIEEAQRVPQLGEFLAVINSAVSPFETVKCDAWASREINPEEEIFGAACKFGSYVDLVFSAEPSRLMLGLPFATTLMLILLAHEMGHYLYCRYYGVYATLPFFIPAPTLIGTLGAFIRIRSPIRSRAALFDIGIAGPIAGFVVALAVLVLALRSRKRWLMRMAEK